ncbi:MAG: glycoside hydrolase family 92 protein, partial [Armatimonadetes bacterium]|nr:glycoside hydrolase family 92 protein [Armatimonadota bacterium]
DVVVGDACVRGITGFDREAAYAGMVKHAHTPGDPAGNYGRLGIEDYLAKGYVPADKFTHATSRTLDYAYDDFCLSQVAEALGRHKDVEAYRRRALNYRHVYDPGVGFMRGRNADGGWQEPFDEFAWGDPYIEGGAWQSTWAVQHDPAGLIALMGGPEKVVQKLDRMLAQPPTFHVGTYGQEIHEMTEMARAPFGQYAHSNQPVHHVLFLYAAAGRPDKTQHWVRRIMDTYYTPDSLPGDEDNGEMCSWYVLNALGFYPLTPGHPSFVFSSPLFRAVRVHLANGKTLTITAEHNAPENVYVQRLAVNGRPHDKLWIAHDDLARGGHLQFTMGDQPLEKDYSRQPDALPPSLSPYEG